LITAAGKDSDGAGTSVVSESRMNRIARRAHEIYESRGGHHGQAVEDWLRAEREIDAEIEMSRVED
jgi:DUF2934 family protein